jgi:hypothetical protein
VSAATAVYVPGTTTQGTGAVTVAVDSSDDTQSFILNGAGAPISRTGATTTFTTGLPVGPQQVQITPISKFSPPIPGANTGSTATLGVTSVGAPFYTGSGSAAATGTSITFTGPSLNANYSPEPTSQVWVAWVQGSTAPTCSMNGSGQAQITGPGTWTSATNTISGLNPNTMYNAAVCGSNEFGASLSGLGSAFTWVAPDAPTGDTTYLIRANPQQQGNQYNYGVDDPPHLDGKPGFSVWYWYDGVGQSQDFDPDHNAGVQITAAYCVSFNNSLCGTHVNIDPEPGTPLSRIRVTFPSGCVWVADSGDVTFLGAVGGSDATVDVSSGTQYVVTWTQAPYLNQNTITRDIDYCF